MKELSIEDKAKCYDKAIERAKDFMNGEVHYALRRGENIMYWIFPELREDEDEKIRKYLIDVVNDYCKGSEHDGCIAWLEKQGEQVLANSAKTCKDEQTPAWSEEDSAMLDNIIAWIEGKWGTLGGKVGGREAFISFLKSLKDRYAWKPSEEQMKSLRNILRYFEMLGAYGESIDGLKELEEQLKKLREE